MHGRQTVRVEIRLVVVWDDIGFGAFEQSVRFMAVGSTVVGFGRKTSKDAQFRNSKTVSW
jgi:hypothetical protein